MKVGCADTAGFHFPLGLTTDFLASMENVRRCIGLFSGTNGPLLATVLITITDTVLLTVKHVKVLHATGDLMNLYLPNIWTLCSAASAGQDSNTTGAMAFRLNRILLLLLWEVLAGVGHTSVSPICSHV